MELFLLRCLLLTLLSCTLIFSTVPASADLVLDTEGHPVITGLPYYVQRALGPGPGRGSLGWTTIIDSCHLNVILHPPVPPTILGPPVMFFPEEKLRQNKSVLLTETLSVMFAAPPPCDASTLWKFNTPVELVTTGGVAPLPSEPSESRFRILHYPGYEFESGVYQFMVCPDEPAVCLTLGINHEDQLAESNDPFAFQFTKAF